MKLSDLFNNGSVIALHVGKWRARAKIVPSDLGITDTADVRQALQFGTHRLIDPKAFDEINEIEREAKNGIERNSLAFEMIPGARYIPEARVEERATELKRQRELFYGAVSVLCGSYEPLRWVWQPVVRAALVAACRDEGKAEDAFRRILSQYPDVEDVRRRFSFRWQVYTLRSVDKGKLGELFDEQGEVRSVIQGMVEGLRKEVTERVKEVLELIARGGKITKRTINSAIEVLDRVEALNVVGDSELQAQIRSARDVLRTVTPETSDEVVVNGLSTVVGNLQGDMSKAIAEAEDALTGFGRRKIAV